MTSLKEKFNSKDQNITIKDIAQIADVSISTVSRVLNDSDLVGKKTKKRVQKIIQEYDFIPNNMARGLLKKTSKAIALIIPDISNPYFAELFHGVEDGVNPHGYSIFLCNSNYSHKKESDYIKEMAERRVDGLIIVSAYINDRGIIHNLNKKMRIVTVQTQIEGIDGVQTNVEQGTMDSIEYLIKLGHSKIAFICLDTKENDKRYKAYMRALEQNDISVRQEYIYEGHMRGNVGYEAAKYLLELPDPPTAVQTFNDYIAFGVYTATMEKGLKIPEDLSVVGFDDVAVGKLLNPPLTTVSQPIYTMGEVAADLLFKNIIDGPKPVPREVILPTKLQIRGSASHPKY